jgi:hypothetical protein
MNQRKENPTFVGKSGSLNPGHVTFVIPVKTRKIDLFL